VIDLNSRIPRGENADVLDARDINNAGPILARGFDNNAVGFRTIILTPKDESIPGDIDGNGAVNVQDLRALLAAWGHVTVWNGRPILMTTAWSMSPTC